MLNVIFDEDDPSALVLHLDQKYLSYVSPGKYKFSSKGSKKVLIKGLDDKRQITVTFAVSPTGFLLPIQLIYQGKSKKILPKFAFHSNFDTTFTPNHWSRKLKNEKFIYKEQGCHAFSISYIFSILEKYLVDFSSIILVFQIHCLPKRKLFVLFLQKCIID